MSRARVRLLTAVVSGLLLMACVAGVEGLQVPGAVAATKSSLQVSPSSAVPGEAVTATGAIRGGGARVVLLQVRRGTKWKTVVKARTTAKGKYAMVTRGLAKAIDLRVLAPRSSRKKQQLTPVRSVAVARQSAALAGPTSAELNQPFTLTATALPLRRGRTVALQQWMNGSWSQVASRVVGTSSRIAFSVSNSAAGTTLYRVRAAAWNGAPAITSASAGVEATATAAGQIQRVSMASDGTPANGYSYARTMSADGRYIAFDSIASNLVPNDNNNMVDAFVWDRDTGHTHKVSTAPDGADADASSGVGSISADGRYVAFTSNAANLAPDNYGSMDVFVWDRETGQTRMVSKEIDGTPYKGGSSVRRGSMSADGRYIAFESDASHLVPNDTNDNKDVFVWDRETGHTQLVSAAPDGAPADNFSYGASMSADGRYIAFLSAASNLGPSDTPRTLDVFVWDRETGQTHKVTTAQDGTHANSIASGVDGTSISADGRYIAYRSHSLGLKGYDANDIDVFVWDRETSQTRKVSTALDGTQADDSSDWASMSADGRYVAFESEASNLVPNDNVFESDVFVWDRQTGQTRIVSKPPQGNYTNGKSHVASISADGRYIALYSEASNLATTATKDTNNAFDVFLWERDAS